MTTSTGPRPCSASEAVSRALSVANKGGRYILGAGDYDPRAPDSPFTPHMYTTSAGVNVTALGSDCCGFAISFAYKLPRHRSGFNRGPWATISDDINCNSAIEDADHAGELFERVVGAPQVGDLLAYPTVYKDGRQYGIGHVVIVVGVSRVLEWDPALPDWSALDTAECHGPNGHEPGVVLSTGIGFVRHDALWPKPAHRTTLLRVKA